MRPIFFVHLSGAEHEAAAALSALSEAGFGAREFTRPGSRPVEAVWITAEVDAGPTTRFDDARAACEAAQAAIASAAVSFGVREYGTSVADIEPSGLGAEARGHG